MDHDSRGRFMKGNRAATRRRPDSSRLTTQRIISKADSILTSTRREGTIDQLGSILAQLIDQAQSGNTAAGTWLLDRLAPRERIWLSSTLPSPTANPLTFIDELVARVSDGEISVDQAAKLSNLAKPFMVDAELQSMRIQIDDLVTIVGNLEQTKKRSST